MLDLIVHPYFRSPARRILLVGGLFCPHPSSFIDLPKGKIERLL